MPDMLGAEYLILLLITAAGVDCGGIKGNVMRLERVFPVRAELEVLRARDRARHARILQGLVGGVANFPVRGSSDPQTSGIYYTKVKLGSPPKEFNVQIDTGSDVLWVACSTCSDCPKSSGLGIELNFFDTASSSTATLVPCSHPTCSSLVQTTAASCSSESNQCGYSFLYGDGSGTSGLYISDLLYFDTILGPSLVANSSAPIVFGCSSYQSGDLAREEHAIDGIFGFGPQDLSVISQLSSQGVTPKVFSHCLIGSGDGGGTLVLGEILDPSIVYSPLVPSQPHYNLYLQNIAVNGQILPINSAVFSTSDNKGTIVDSGTTLSYLVEEAYDPFISAINSAVSLNVTLVTSSTGHQCYLMSTSIIEMFPVVALNFAGGSSMVLRPKDYLINSAEGAAKWCVGFLKDQGQGYSILGDLVLKDKIFVYDLTQRRLGWADYDCSSSVNVSITIGRDQYINAREYSKSSSFKNTWYHNLIVIVINLLVYVNVCSYKYCKLQLTNSM